MSLDASGMGGERVVAACDHHDVLAAPPKCPRSRQATIQRVEQNHPAGVAGAQNAQFKGG
jgi:hypothetical protein